MSKQKTHKAVAKRFKITKNDKVIKTAAGQGHFNSRDTGKARRNKRRDKQVSSTVTKTIKNYS